MSTILNVTDSLSESAGGLSHATLNLAVSTSKHLPDHRLTVLSHQDSTEVDSNLIECPTNLAIEKVECFRNSYFPFPLGLYKKILDFQPDLIHLRGLWRQSSFACLKWKKEHPDLKLIVQPAGMLEPWARKRNGLSKRFYYSLFESRLFQACDAIHATSIAEADNLIAMGLPSEKMFIIEEGIYIPSLSFSNRIDRSPDKAATKQLLFLSRIHPKKGIELLLNAIALLRPQNWTCKIVGMGSLSYERILKKRVQRLGLENIVFFEGPLYGQKKAAMFRDSDAFVLPTYSENFGIAIAEAMSWGLPVITTTGTPWSALSDPSMGWYIKPNVNDLSYALFCLFSKDNHELNAMGERCRSFVESNFSWNTVGERMARKYVSLIGY